MDSAGDTAEAVGCPIRKSTDRSLLAAPRGLSQRAASFIASQCQGIHQMPFRRLISFSYAPRAGESPQRPRPARAHPFQMHHRPNRQSFLAERPTCRVVLGHKFSSHVKDPIPASAGICVLSRGYLLAIGHRRSSFVILPRSPGGGGRDRTDDLMLAKHALSQLSYAPLQRTEVRNQKRPTQKTFWLPASDFCLLVGQGRLELPTSRLSSARSNQLSY
jgi:hypothetical protein